MTKTCPKCKEEKDSGEFHRDRTKKDKLSIACKACRRVPQEVRKKNSVVREQSITSMGKKVCQKCKEEKGIEEFSRSEEQKDGSQSKCKACFCAYRKSNCEQLKVKERASYEKNRERDLANNKKYLRDHPEIRKARHIKRRALLKKSQIGKIDIRVIIKRHGMLCHLCGIKLTKKTLTIDHLIPISKGGPTVNWNLAPACNSCNIKKGNRFITPAQMPLFVYEKAA